MNGPEHYHAAEVLIDKSQAVSMDDGYAQLVIAQAQVHATLALAAAQAASTLGMPGNPSSEWDKLIRPRPTITNHSDEPVRADR